MSYDQFFLTDKKIINDLVAGINFNEIGLVLEIGAGKGSITEKLAQKAKKVIAVEIDKRFLISLSKLSRNVTVIIGDALKILDKRKKIDLLIGNLPSSLLEPLMNKIIKVDFKTARFLIPLRFVNKVKNNSPYNLFFDSELIEIVKPVSFSPRPKTNWALVKIIRKPDPIKTKNPDLFIRQYQYFHSQAKVKNAHTEAMIIYYQKALQTKLTKNEARRMLIDLKPSFA